MHTMVSRLARCTKQTGSIIILAALTVCATPPRPPLGYPENRYRMPGLDLHGVGTGAASSLYSYSPATGTQNPATANGVTIEVTPVVADNAAADRYRPILVECQAPDDTVFSVSPVGFGMCIYIQNQTGHIITTARSAIVVEDGAQHEWHLLQGDVRQWIPLISEKIRARYGVFREAVGAYATQVQQSWRNGPWVSADYYAEYDRYRREYDDCQSSLHLRTQGEADPCGERSEIEARAPQVFAAQFRSQAEQELARRVQVANGLIQTKEDACVAAVEQRLSQPGLQVLTQEAYEGGLRILPDHTLDAYLPLDPDFTQAAPEVLHLRLYDLVTATDAAGNPTQRTHFEFQIQRVAGSL